MNLGKYQPDGVICDLAPHDLSILLYLLDQPVAQVSASARSVFQEGIPEVAFLTLTFASGVTANIQISWLAPRKVREMVIVGSQRMVQYDDTAADESVRVFDRGMEFKEPANFGEHQLSYRSGDIVDPACRGGGAARASSCRTSRCAIHTGVTPRSHAQLGCETVDVIEAAEESLRRNGEPMVLERRAGASRGLNERRAPPGARYFAGGAVESRPFSRCSGVEIAKALISGAADADDRPWPSVRSGPKHLVPVANRPILFHNLEALRRAGMLEATIAARARERASDDRRGRRRVRVGI